MANDSKRRGPWNQEEDLQLQRLVQEHGQANWVKIASHLETRTAKQCRERWHQNLKPSLNLNPITHREGQMILDLVQEMGKRWAEIARRLGNRSDNAVKNWYNGNTNRRERRNRARREAEGQQIRANVPQQMLPAPAYPYNQYPQQSLPSQYPPPQQLGSSYAPPVGTPYQQPQSTQEYPQHVTNGSSYQQQATNGYPQNSTNGYPQSTANGYNPPSHTYGQSSSSGYNPSSTNGYHASPSSYSHNSSSGTNSYPAASNSSYGQPTPSSNSSYGAQPTSSAYQTPTSSTFPNPPSSSYAPRPLNGAYPQSYSSQYENTRYRPQQGQESDHRISPVDQQYSIKSDPAQYLKPAVQDTSSYSYDENNRPPSNGYYPGFNHRTTTGSATAASLPGIGALGGPAGRDMRITAGGKNILN